MPLKIVRNDITRMYADAIVNTAMIIRQLEPVVIMQFIRLPAMMNC